MTPAAAPRAERRRRSGGSPSPQLPPVRIVVLNYNGAGLVERCLGSVLATDYPEFEVVMVDNASVDGSVASVREQFPAVRVIEAGANLGFSRGNDLGLRGAGQPLLALLNPDATVGPDWLRPLVERIQSDPIAGAVGPKILFSQDRVPITVATETFQPGGTDSRELGVRVYRATVESENGAVPVYFNRGAYGAEPDRDGRPFRWTAGQVELAAPSGDGPLRLRLEVAAGDHRHEVPLAITVGGTTLCQTVVGESRRLLGLRVPLRLVRATAQPVVENAGIKPLPDGSMRDRGTRVTHGNVWHDSDGPGYAQPREVFAVKGGAALYRREMLETLGYFDPGIFMYYEDADLCWRARRRGWRFWYEPDAVVRHEHAALSREWSPGFIRNVAFGKLRMLGKNAPPGWLVQHAGTDIKFSLHAGLRATRALVRGRLDAASGREAQARVAALAQALIAWPETARLRGIERRLAPLDGRELAPFYEDE